MSTANTPNSVIGNAQLSYRVVSNWAKIPESVNLGYTHGIVTDAKDHIYVLHTGTPNVLEFAPDGTMVSSWTVEGISNGAHGMYLHTCSEGKESLYLTDYDNGTVVKTSLQGEVLLRLAPPSLPDVYSVEKPYRPTDVAVLPDGRILVSDGYGQNLVHVYQSDGTYEKSWGTTGSERGQLICPHGISVKGNGDDAEIYIADRGNHRIQVFTLEGEHVRFIDHNLDMPCSFYFHDQKMYFPDLHSRVTVFDSEDRLIVHLGEDQLAYKQEGWPNLPKSYYRPDKFSSPHGVCVNSRGDVFVAEWIHDGRITKLESIV